MPSVRLHAQRLWRNARLLFRHVSGVCLSGQHVRQNVAGENKQEIFLVPIGPLPIVQEIGLSPRKIATALVAVAGPLARGQPAAAVVVMGFRQEKQSV